ncbi:MAG: rhodanese-like domain-containing protein [Planctomycetota bacterium]
MKMRQPIFRPDQEICNYITDLKLGPAEWMKDVLKANYACATDPRAAWIPADAPACEVKGTLAGGVNAAAVTGVAPAEVRRKLAAAPPPILLDVREAGELTGELGHIDGVTNIPVGDLVRRLKELDKFKDREIITVCRSGGRAGTAARILIQAGFKRVLVMTGGMMAWNAGK